MGSTCNCWIVSAKAESSDTLERHFTAFCTTHRNTHPYIHSQCCNMKKPLHSLENTHACTPTWCKWHMCVSVCHGPRRRRSPSIIRHYWFATRFRPDDNEVRYAPLSRIIVHTHTLWEFSHGTQCVTCHLNDTRHAIVAFVMAEMEG